MADAELVDRRTIEDYSIFDPVVQSDPAEFYKLLRDEHPVYNIPDTNIYVVSRFDDVRAVCLDNENFSTNIDEGYLQGKNWHIFQDVIAERGMPIVPALNSLDPPEHTRHRQILNRVFMPKRMKALEPHIREVANYVLDQFIDRGEVEFISEFALPMSGMIISEQIGFERGDIAKFKHWSNSILAPGLKPCTKEELLASAEITLELQKFCVAIFEDRAKNPREDVVSTLVEESRSDESPLSLPEMIGIMRTLIAGGFETVEGALSNAMWLLLRYPEVAAQIRADRSLIPSFVEEALRYEGAVQGLVRRVKQDVEVAGTVIPKDAMVMIRFAAANLDERKFECPHKFDISRKNNAHMAWGTGIHMCVGRPLARLELIVAFETIFDRMSSFELARPLPFPTHLPNVMTHSMRELPIRFTKA